MTPPDTLSLAGGLELAAGPTHAELDLALREVFDAPGDRIVWDAGQGRAISTALGMALAAARQGEGEGEGLGERRVVAVIGDRALSAGMAFEALNHAGSLSGNLLVILDDRQLSSEQDLGALSNRVVRALSGRLYAHLREGGRKMLSKMPTVRELARRSEKHLKGMVLPGTLFEEMGFNYIGPASGHDVEALVKTLRNVRQLHGPQFLHVVTGPGGGARSADAGPVRARAQPQPGSYARAFGRWLCDAAVADARLVAITPGPVAGAGLAEFALRFPDRFFELALAEQHAVTFAAGLATQGLKPVVALDSALLQRGYDQVVHDVALQELAVTFAVSTDQASCDLSFLRCLPGVVVMAPADEIECRRMLRTAIELSGPAFVRFPGDGPGAAADTGQGAADPLPVGRGEIRREGEGLAILVFGAPLEAAAAVAERLDATLVNMRCVKPLDAELVAAVAARHQALVTIEESAVAGGAGCGVGELLATLGVPLPRLHLGIPDRFIAADSRWSWLAAAGLDAAGLRQSIEPWWASVRASIQPVQ